MQLQVRYVDGKSFTCAPCDWVALPGQGVDMLIASNEAGACHFGGHSVYWTYRDNTVDAWAVGQASFGYSYTPPEVLFYDNGSMLTREIKYVPDLQHNQVKLGWWRPGTVGRVE